MGSSTSLRAEGTQKALFLLKADPRVLHLPRLFYFALNIPASRGWSSHPQSQGWCGSRPQVINARLHLSVSPAAGCKVGAPPAWPQAPRLCVLCRNLPSFLGRISNSSWLRAAPRIAPKGPTAFLRHGNPAAQTPPSFLAPCCVKHAVPTCSEQHDSHSFFNLKKEKKSLQAKTDLLLQTWYEPQELELKLYRVWMTCKVTTPVTALTVELLEHWISSVMTTFVVYIANARPGFARTEFWGGRAEMQRPEVLLSSPSACLFQLAGPFLLSQALVLHLFVL